MSGPMRPDDVALVKTAQIPDYVFDAFNEVIARGWRRSSARVLQKDVVTALERRLPDDVTIQDCFERGWFDVEDSYRAVGWDVAYDKPAYNEDYDAYFVFSRKG